MSIFIGRFEISEQGAIYNITSGLFERIFVINSFFLQNQINIATPVTGINVKKEGWKILGTHSKKLDYLVVGDSKPTTKKVDKAKQLNVKILDENSWYSLLNRWTGIN